MLNYYIICKIMEDKKRKNNIDREFGNRYNWVTENNKKRKKQDIKKQQS